MKERKLLQTQEGLDSGINSPCKYLKKCIENSMEKLHTDITVQRLKQQLKTTGFDCSLQQISPYTLHRVMSKCTEDGHLPSILRVN